MMKSNKLYILLLATLILGGCNVKLENNQPQNDTSNLNSEEKTNESSKVREIFYGKMDLKSNEVLNEDFMQTVIKMETCIQTPEMAGEIGRSYLMPYIKDKKDMDFTLIIQYMDNKGYYYVCASDASTAFGYKAGVILDEKDGRVIYTWVYDPDTLEG